MGSKLRVTSGSTQLLSKASGAWKIKEGGMCWRDAECVQWLWCRIHRSSLLLCRMLDCGLGVGGKDGVWWTVPASQARRLQYAHPQTHRCFRSCLELLPHWAHFPKRWCSLSQSVGRERGGTPAVPAETVVGTRGLVRIGLGLGLRLGLVKVRAGKE